MMATDLASAIFFFFTSCPFLVSLGRVICASAVDKGSPQQSQEEMSRPQGTLQRGPIAKYRGQNHTLGCEPTPSNLLVISVPHLVYDATSNGKYELPCQIYS